MKLAILATATVTVAALASTPATAVSASAADIAQSRTYRMRGVDIVGKDLSVNYPYKDAEKCYAFCVAVAGDNGGIGCSGATWTNFNGGTCWPKDTGFTGTATVPNAGADSFVMLKDSTNTSIWSGTSLNVDMPGNDLTTTRQKFMQDCRTDCSNVSECYAVVWTNYNGGTCWLKRRASAFVPSAGAQSAYVAKEFTVKLG